MNITSEELKKIFSLDENEKVELEKDLLHFAFIKHIQCHMDNKKRKDIAKAIGVSNSFISQLFSGDKKINIDLMIKFQRVLNFKFIIESVPDETPVSAGITPLYTYKLETSLPTTQTTHFKTVNEKQG